MSRDSRIAFEVRGKCVIEFKDGEWSGSYLWNPSPVTLEETEMSEPCIDLLRRYVLEQGTDIENEDGTLLKGFNLDELAEKDDIDSLSYGTPESKREARVHLITLVAHHYCNYRICASDFRIVSNIENHN